MSGNGRRLISWGMAVCLGLLGAVGGSAYGMGSARAEEGTAAAKGTALRIADVDPAVGQALQACAQAQGETLTELAATRKPEKLTGAQATETLSVTGATSLTALAWLPRLKTLTLTGCDKLDLTGLAAHPALETLTLTDCAAADLTPLTTCLKLQSLTITRSDAKAMAEAFELAPLAGCARLSALCLNGACVTGLTAIPGLEKLSSLTINGAQSMDVTPLAQAAGLKTLRLYGATGKPLATALAGLKRLEGLWLGDCDLTPEASAALWNCTRLKNLGFSHVNGVSADEAGWARLKSLTSLTMEGGRLDGLAFLAPFTATTVVRLAEVAVGEAGTVCSVDFDKYFLALTNVPPAETLPMLTATMRQWNYATLRMQTGEITPAQITALCSIKGLLSLDVQAVAADAFATECWNGFAGLQQLKLGNCKAVSLAPIGALPSLNRLVLTGCGVSGESAIADIRKLRLLSLTDCTVADWAFLDNLTCGKTLTTLAIAGCDGLRSAAFASRLPALSDLALEDTAIADLSPLTGLTGLRRLYLYGSPIADYTPLSALSALERLGCAENAVLPELTAQVARRRFIALP